MENKSNCLICNEELVYSTEPVKMKCMICGGEFETTVSCRNGHYICDDCHCAKGVEAILEVCSKTDSKNPIEIMQGLMRTPAIFMHGPEHHVMVGAALLAAYRNAGGDIDLGPALKEMERRGKQVPGGACGFWGCCGAGVSTGIFLSIAMQATPLTKESWGLSNQMTAAALGEIGKLGGPRCCKRDSFVAAKTAVLFVKEHLGIEMELPEKIKCEFMRWNEQCIKLECPYFRGE
ncbi:DUF5714 domain-containing protein [Hespellia stercorisuis]|uniref:DUF5714 domain-containing protein n=1 Tax=Hespellia stercorisuis DSM 15480 TaxID=1121950 RepID=A0A1M6Q868_9FIRM|nr:DUF5714 domain-containing protein [Hespellia stercorisuis]SHK16307.1 hypothetical protein SAMN02745243_02348 [Hespellia stercorisuis DSM 15480]